MLTHLHVPLALEIGMDTLGLPCTLHGHHTQCKLCVGPHCLGRREFPCGARLLQRSGAALAIHSLANACRRGRCRPASSSVHRLLFCLWLPCALKMQSTRCTLPMCACWCSDVSAHGKGDARGEHDEPHSGDGQGCEQKRRSKSKSKSRTPEPRRMPLLGASEGGHGEDATLSSQVSGATYTTLPAPARTESGTGQAAGLMPAGAPAPGDGWPAPG